MANSPISTTPGKLKPDPRVHDWVHAAAPAFPTRAEISALPIDKGERWARGAVTCIFAVAAAYTLYASLHMTGGMLMPGGWTMPMMWMVMPGQTLLGAGCVFLLMWQAMMIAMMLPSSWPMLDLYARAARHAGHRRPMADTLMVATGYFAVWLAFGIVAFALGMGLSKTAMSSIRMSRWVPAGGGLALIASGVWQLTPLKQACLKHCRDPLFLLAHTYRRGKWGAWRVGVHHGAFCAACCWALMAMQLLLGVMNLVVMAVIACVIAAEKLWRRGPLLARLVGVASVAAGIFLVFRAI